MREADLIEKSINGDVKSFELLIKDYQVYAYNIALRMMKNPEDAKDVSQDALIKVYKNIKRFKKDSSFSTWLYRIVINTCKDELKRRKETISIDEREESYDVIESKDNNYNPVTEYERKDIREKINGAIYKLPINNRTAIILRDIEGYSYEEISKIEETTIGTIKSRINRGRKILREILKAELQTVSEF
ncbi:sigma-70 family RNA polymerase sigma factor [Helicovermis profundi]|uniref:Sigma-70 family RNA polymerase sigma factor n=1 Tax=Helicovermis profundi TaxID=3065157 RepID=A0AAU9EEQ2_9FIRM|nr:sigma-70 family RNA polymerase sigma factor [Clostridia bacterium S502]